MPKCVGNCLATDQIYLLLHVRLERAWLALDVNSQTGSGIGGEVFAFRPPAGAKRSATRSTSVSFALCKNAAQDPRPVRHVDCATRRWEIVGDPFAAWAEPGAI